MLGHGPWVPPGKPTGPPPSCGCNLAAALWQVKKDTPNKGRCEQSVFKRGHDGVLAYAHSGCTA